MSAAVLPLFGLESNPIRDPDLALVTSQSQSAATPIPAVPVPAKPATKLGEVLPVGRLIELSGSRGRTTFAVSMVIRAQRRDEPVVWVQLAGGSMYPPDLAESGVDLDALVVVQVPRDRVGRAGGYTRHADGTFADGVRLAKASELLLRSGAFGLVVIDLETAPRGDAWQGRLGGLARAHGCQVVLLTSSDADAPSLGPLVGMRIVPSRTRTAPGRFVLDHAILKDKSGQVGAMVGAGSPTAVSATDGHRAPPGLG